MNKKVLGILVMTLLITTVVLPVTGTMNVGKTQVVEKSIVHDDSSSDLGYGTLGDGNKCAWSGEGGNLNNVAFIEIDLTGVGIVATLSFYHQYEIESGYDYGFIEVSNDGGASWSALASYTGSLPDWTPVSLDLSAFIGGEILVRFRYMTSPIITYEGWYVDDIAIDGDSVSLYDEDFEGYEVGDPWGDWIIVEKAIDVEHITIGSGTHCFSFAIFTDPQSDVGKLNNAITWVNNNYVAEKIKFVIVASDLIQGEKASGYDNDFTAIRDALNNNLNTNVRWTPEPGNHDYWCNLAGQNIHRPDCSWIPQYTDTTYPEDHFNNVFGPVYTSLADLAGWTKQGGMPLTNQHGYPPPTYFQNFVFDYGNYHFVCLDWCARDDFNPGDWTIITSIGTFTYPKFQFGYARIQTAYGNDGTIKWFEDHLEKYGYCDPNRYNHGYKRSKNIILISHHAPIFNLKGTANSGTFQWELQNENTYGFNQNEYNNIVALLNSLSSNHDFNYRWFTGHYEVKNMEWIDTAITPNTPVKVIASVQPLSWVPSGLPISPDPTITINNAYTVTTADNNVGQITIVKVLQPGGTAPDPSIYSQGDPDAPTPVVWDNPDIEFYDQSGCFVPSGQLNYAQQYEIQARIYNKGCSEAEINVRFTWSKQALNWVDQESGFTGGSEQNNNIIGPITIPSGKEEWVSIQYWDTSVVAPGAGGDVVHACVRANIEPINPDSNLNNNRGCENCDVHGCQTKASDETIEFSFPITNPTDITNGITVDVYPEVGTLWDPSIILPELAPGEEGNVTLRLNPIPGVARNVEDSEIFSLTAIRLDTNETTGGLDVKVIVDDFPILDWTGDNGYQTDGVEPDEGNAGTTFTFRVNYKDENNHAPASGYPQLYLSKGDEQIQGSPFVMNEEDPTDTVYTDGKTYTYSITLTEAEDDYVYWFWARDKHGIEAKGPAIHSTSGPEVFGPDLECEGSINWSDVKPGSTVTGTIYVKNMGDPFSELDWKVCEYPPWGTWTFTPSGGDDLKPEDGKVTVQVTVVVPNEKNKQFTGQVKICNKEDTSDYCIIQVSLATPKNKPYINTPFLNFLQNHPILFQLLQRFFNL